MLLADSSSPLSKGTYLGKNEQSFNAEGIIVSKTIYTERVSEEWHSHENHHITFILTGGNREQRKNQELEVVAGTVLNYRSGEKHRNVNTWHPSRNINLEISEDFFRDYGIHPSSFDFLNHREIDAKLVLLKIYEQCRSNLHDSTFSIHSLLLSLLETGDRNIKSGSPPFWLEKVKEMVHDRWNEPLSLSELSEAAGVHPVSVSKFFPRHFHLTLGEYQRKLRLANALTLLRQGSRSLTDVAHYCGFFDQSHFTRTFRQETGLLPKEFRKL
jgi:AraC family transcriptional regulator